MRMSLTNRSTPPALALCMVVAIVYNIPAFFTWLIPFGAFGIAYGPEHTPVSFWVYMIIGGALRLACVASAIAVLRQKQIGLWCFCLSSLLVAISSAAREGQFSADAPIHLTLAFVSLVVFLVCALRISSSAESSRSESESNQE